MESTKQKVWNAGQWALFSILLASVAFVACHHLLIWLFESALPTVNYVAIALFTSLLQAYLRRAQPFSLRLALNGRRRRTPESPHQGSTPR